MVLFAGMTQDIDLLIGSILAGGGAGAGQEERVFLAARCIEENDAARLDPMLRGQTVAGLLHLSNADYEPRIPVRVRAVRALQRLQDASAIPQLVRLTLEPNRTNWMGKRTVEYSGVRLAAIAALRTLGVPALDQVRAAVPAAAAPIESWIAGDVQALAAALYGGEDQVRPIAAFLLGMLSRSEADDILIPAFAQPDRKPLLAWAIADALTLVNPARVTREAIAPSIDPELGTPLSVPKEAAKARRDRLRQLAYLIGKTKPLEPWAGRFLDWCIGESRDAALKGYTIRAFGDLLEGTRLPLLESIARGDFADIAADPGWTQRDRLWLRNEALETLALLGDRETALRLRRDRIAEGPWPPELELALFRTGEEIAARTWEDEGPAARPRGP